jgi:hypothetical protein
MSTPPPVKRLKVSNAERQRELDAELGGTRRGPSALGNVPRSPEVYVPTARNLLQRYPIPEPVDPRSISPFPWKKRVAGMPWLGEMQEKENYAKLPRLTKRKRNNQPTNEQVPKKLNFDTRKKSKKSRRTRKTRKN